MVAKLYYSTYICQLWSGDSNQMSNQMSKKGSKTEGKRSSEGFRGIIILLILAKAQSLSLGQALHLGQACRVPGHHSSLW